MSILPLSVCLRVYEKRMSCTKWLMSLIIKKSNLVEMQRIIHLKTANWVRLDISFYTSSSPFVCQALLWTQEWQFKWVMRLPFATECMVITPKLPCCMLWWSYSAGKLINNHLPHEYGWDLINISHSHILKRHTTKFIIYSYNKIPHIWKTYLGYKVSIAMDVQTLEEFPLRSGTEKDIYWDHCYWWWTLWWRSWPGWLWKTERLK